MGSWVGHLSVVSRSSVGGIGQGIREVKKTAILTNSLFWVLEFFGRSLVLLWFVLGLLHGVDIQGTREQNLNKKNFCQYSFIWRSCLPCTALPCSHTAAWPQGSRPSMYCAYSSKWGLFGRNTRSAFRRTPSPWFVLGSSLVFYPRKIGKVLRKEILILGINYEW